MKKNYIIIKSQEELDNLPENYSGDVLIKFGTAESPAIIKNNRKLTIIISDNYVANVSNSTKIFVEKYACVDALYSTIKAYNNSIIHATTSYVEAYHNTGIKAYYSNIKAYDNSNVTCSNSKVTAYDKTNIAAFDKSKIKVNSNNCKIVLFHESVLI